MIGLATPCIVNNFGTKLQALAMQTAVRNLGHETEIINFRFKDKGNPIKSVLFCDALRYRLEGRKNAKAIAAHPEVVEGGKLISAAYNRFVEERLHLSEPCDLLSEAREIARKYTHVVCGSDQIWLPSHILLDFYTLNFVPEGVKRVAYAPSFGVSQVSPFMRGDYRRFLERLDVVTAREDRGVELVKELSGRDCPMVVDPTLLLTREQWDETLNTTQYQDEAPYVFAYLLGDNPEHRRLAREYADKMGYRLVMPHLYKYSPVDEQYADEIPYGMSPEDFVARIASAKAVFTDSFHGSVFSLLYGRELYVMERFAKGSKGSTNSRIYSLLRLTDLAHRLVHNFTLDELQAIAPIDYQDVHSRLSRARESSLTLLANALKEE